MPCFTCFCGYNGSRRTSLRIRLAIAGLQRTVMWGNVRHISSCSRYLFRHSFSKGVVRDLHGLRTSQSGNIAQGQSSYRGSKELDQGNWTNTNTPNCLHPVYPRRLFTSSSILRIMFSFSNHAPDGGELQKIPSHRGCFVQFWNSRLSFSMLDK